MIYQGILDSGSITRLFEFNNNSEYILTYIANGTEYQKVIKGHELSNKLNELECIGSYGSLAEINNKTN